jgi:Holliday junction resolvase RusA-like endonuclease
VSDAIIIVIGGEPVAKGRPRMTRKGFAYTPAATRKYEAHGRLAAQLAMDGRPPLTCPCRAEITIDLPVPASWSAKRQGAALRGEIKPTSRPDADNYIKAALDSVNEIVVADDSQIVEIIASKRYAPTPQLSVTITPLPAFTAQGGPRRRPPTRFSMRRRTRSVRDEHRPLRRTNIDRGSDEARPPHRS